MPASLTNKIGFSYNYGLGENGWKSGYDENWIRVDSLIVSTNGYNRDTTLGLTYGYLGGYSYDSGGNLTLLAAGTILLTNNATNYVERNPVSGAVSKNTVGFTSSKIPMAVVTTLGGTVTNVVDARVLNSGKFTYPIVTGEVGVLDLTYPVGNVKRYGATGLGVVDDTVFIQNAIDSVSGAGATLAPAANGGKVEFPFGVYLTTAQLNVYTYGISIIGTGDRSTTFLFNPAAPATCIRWANTSTASPLFNCGLYNIQFQSTNAIQKTACKFIDISTFEWQRINIHYSWTSTAFDSIGCEFHGREIFKAKNWSNYADRPFIFVQNERDPVNKIDMDFFKFEGGLVHAAASQYCFWLDPTLRSVQHPLLHDIAFVGGKGCVSWDGAGATQDSQGWVFSHLRSEQMTGGGAEWFVNFNRDNFTILGTTYINCAPSSGNGGIKHRRTRGTLLISHKWMYIGGNNMFDMDNTNSDIKWIGLETQNGGLFSLPGLTMVTQSTPTGGGYALPANAEYHNAASTFDVQAMSQLLLNGPLGQNITPVSQFGFYSNRTLAAVGGVADMLRLIPALVASVNGDTLTGITLGPSYNPNGKSAVTGIALRINDVAGLANNFSIQTGLGRHQLGDNLEIGVAGKGFQVKEGANAKQGVSVLAAGTVVVANTSVTANSRIQLTSNVDGGTPGFVRVSARVPGTSFTILSSNAADTSTIAWDIFEPAH